MLLAAVLRAAVVVVGASRSNRRVIPRDSVAGGAIPPPWEA